MNHVELFFAAIAHDSLDARRRFLAEKTLSPRLQQNVSVLLEMDETLRRDAEKLADSVLPFVDATLDTSLGLLDPSSWSEALGRIDKYEILRVIGLQNDNICLEGFDVKLLRIVLIRVPAYLSSNVSAENERFRRQASTAATISSPYVSEVFTCREYNGTPYVVTEVLQGATLDERISTGAPFSVEELSRIGGQVAKGLAAIHAAGLQHGRLGLESVVFVNGTGDVAIQRPRFGCKFQSKEEGSPQGFAANDRTDLLALGVMLYAMATGVRPLRLSAAETVTEEVRLNWSGKIPSIREQNPEISPALDDLICRLLAKTPEDRIASALDVVARLEANASIPVQACNTRSGTRRFVRSLVGVAAVGLTLLATVAFALQMAYPQTPLRRMFFCHWIGGADLQIYTDEPNLHIIGRSEHTRFETRGPNVFAVPIGDYTMNVVRHGVVIKSEQVRLKPGVNPLMFLVNDLLQEKDVANRVAAEWILRKGGRVFYLPPAEGSPARQQELRSVADLPQNDFELVQVELRNLAPVDVIEACQLLANCGPLKSVVVNDSVVSGESLAALAKLRSVESLELSNVIDATRGDFMALAAMPNLQHLSLTYSPHASELCATVPHLQHLRTLAIIDCPVTDEMSLYISQATTLESLAIQSRKFQGDKLTQLQNLRSLHSLKVLSPLISDAAWEQLRDLRKVESLEIGGLANRLSKIEGEGIALPSTVKELTLSGVCIDRDLLQKVAKLNQLESLEFRDSSFIGGELETLTAMQDLDSLSFANVRVGWEALDNVQVGLLRRETPTSNVFKKF